MLWNERCASLSGTAKGRLGGSSCPTPPDSPVLQSEKWILGLFISAQGKAKLDQVGPLSSEAASARQENELGETIMLLARH